MRPIETEIFVDIPQSSNQPFLLNQNKRPEAIEIISATTKRYPYFQRSSGMCSKFIPYNPAVKSRGMKIEEMVVSVFITSLVRLQTIAHHFLERNDEFPLVENASLLRLEMTISRCHPGDKVGVRFIVVKLRALVNVGNILQRQRVNAKQPSKLLQALTSSTPAMSNQTTSYWLSNCFASDRDSGFSFFAPCLPYTITLN